MAIIPIHIMINGLWFGLATVSQGVLLSTLDIWVNAPSGQLRYFHARSLPVIMVILQNCEPKHPSSCWEFIRNPWEGGGRYMMDIGVSLVGDETLYIQSISLSS